MKGMVYNCDVEKAVSKWNESKENYSSMCEVLTALEKTNTEYIFELIIAHQHWFMQLGLSFLMVTQTKCLKWKMHIILKESSMHALSVVDLIGLVLFIKCSKLILLIHQKLTDKKPFFYFQKENIKKLINVFIQY